MFFLDDGLAVPLGPLWFLPPLKKFLAQMTLTLSSSVILTVGGLACNTSDMNQPEEKCVVLVVIKR
jgi:hypothetical protein